MKKSYEHSKQPVNVLYEAIKEYIEETAGIKSVSLRAVTQILGVSGFVYLTSVMDLFSRKIVSWVLTKDMTAESVLEAIKIAQERRNIEKPVIIHSDRGIQFTSELYKEITEKMKRSYSKKACPWDNACIESFHSLIKRE
ncbi:MAG: transposase [Coprobacillus cateniformis]